MPDGPPDGEEEWFAAATAPTPPPRGRAVAAQICRPAALPAPASRVSHLPSAAREKLGEGAAPSSFADQLEPVQRVALKSSRAAAIEPSPGPLRARTSASP